MSQYGPEFFRKYADIIAEAEKPFVSTGNPEVDKLLQTPQGWALRRKGYSDEDIVNMVLATVADKPNQAAYKARRDIINDRLWRSSQEREKAVRDYRHELATLNALHGDEHGGHTGRAFTTDEIEALAKYKQAQMQKQPAQQQAQQQAQPQARPQTQQQASNSGDFSAAAAANAFGAAAGQQPPPAGAPGQQPPPVPPNAPPGGRTEKYMGKAEVVPKGPAAKPAIPRLK